MERAVEEWGVIPGDSLAKLARFSCLACVLPPLPANPLWDTWPWLSPWFFQQLPPVTPSDPAFWIPKGKRGGLCQGLGAPPAAPQLRARVRLHFNPSPCSGILLPTELPLFTQLRGIGLQGSQIPFSPFPSENTSPNNEEIGRCHLIAPKEPVGPGAGGLQWRWGWGCLGWPGLAVPVPPRGCHPKIPSGDLRGEAASTLHLLSWQQKYLF